MGFVVAELFSTYIGTSNLTDLFDLHRGNRSVPSIYAKVSMIVCRWILALPVGL